MGVIPIIVAYLFFFWAQHHQRVKDDLDDGVVFKLAHADNLAEGGDGNPKSGIGTQGFKGHAGVDRFVPSLGMFSVKGFSSCFKLHLVHFTGLIKN